MGSPAFFGKLVNFQAAERKPMLIPFGLFNPQDNLSFIASVSSGSQLTQATVSYASALVIDVSVADVISVTLTGNVASMTLDYTGVSTIPTGQRLWIRLVQDATGGRTVALPSNLICDSGFAVDHGASRATVLPIQWNGTHWIFFDTSFSVPTA